MPDQPNQEPTKIEKMMMEYCNSVNYVFEQMRELKDCLKHRDDIYHIAGASWKLQHAHNLMMNILMDTGILDDYGEKLKFRDSYSGREM